MARKYHVFKRDGGWRAQVWTDSPGPHVEVVDEAEFVRRCPNVSRAWRMKYGSDEPERAPTPDPEAEQPRRRGPGRPRKHPLADSQ